MALTIPDEIIQVTRMSEADLLTEFAAFLYQSERLTLAQASRLAGMTRLDFQRWLSRRRIPIHFEVDDLMEDVRTLEELGRI